MRPENNGILRDAAKGRPSSNNGEAVMQGMRTKQDGRYLMADARRAPLKDQADKTGARALKAAGVTHDLITVPGALEIPAAIAIALDAAANNGKPYDAAIALGCVVRGDTIHFEIVSIESSRALMDLAVARKVPLGNGIITVNTDAQAWARARAGELNKGGDAARAALAMLRIKRRLTKA